MEMKVNGICRRRGENLKRDVKEKKVTAGKRGIPWGDPSLHVRSTGDNRPRKTFLGLGEGKGLSRLWTTTRGP